MDFFILQGIFLAIIIILLLILSMVWPPDSPWAPWWRTNRKVARAMCKLAEVGENDVVYDLGSGDGTTLIVAAKEFGARGVGIEIDPLRYFISSMLLRSNRLSDKVRIIRRNFFDVNISEASVVFVYLVPKALNRLLPKFNKELKKGTRIVSYKYPINLPMIKYDNENEIRLYMIS